MSMTLAEFKERLTSGKYNIPGFARRALGKSKNLTQKEKTEGYAAVDSYFANYEKKPVKAAKSPKAAAKAPREKKAKAEKKTRAVRTPRVATSDNTREIAISLVTAAQNSIDAIVAAHTVDPNVDLTAIQESATLLSRATAVLREYGGRVLPSPSSKANGVSEADVRGRELFDKLAAAAQS